MPLCSSCSHTLAPDARFCAACGASVAGATLSAATLAVRDAPSSHASSAPSDGGRFVPGTILAERYRIVGMLGRGGMGEVYRADDLKLGQAVALKFLPASLSQDGAALARLHREVRVARQISHPNVCRVFDIGEFAGQSFLTMEYIDGEDLSSLLRRIGRLPESKALEISRQLCAGLAAAHDAGVLHRDLKPANVMLDGRGRARITDFGLAGLEAELRGADVTAGTPAYMAPEQLAGREVTQRSDVYALGLVLYEIFTGQRATQDTPLADRVRGQESQPATSPSSLVKDIDPLVERVILRCLEADPAMRPPTALHVAAALPGANPLAAALAAGETPSPEMVAAAPTEGALKPGAAAALLALIALLLVALSVGDRVMMYRVVRMEKAPAVLADRARAALEVAGYPDSATVHVAGTGLDEAYLDWKGDPLKGQARWRRLAAGQPLTFFYWYRQSPAPLMPRTSGGPFEGTVGLYDPPLRAAGEARVVLDPRGRLVEFVAVPPETLDTAARQDSVAWAPFFASAGLDPARFVTAAPRWVPPVFADQRAAWSGALVDHPDLPVRVEAAAVAGRPVAFRVSGPWDDARPRGVRQSASRSSVVSILVAILFAAVLAGSAMLARHNMLRGSGDTRGAFRLAVFWFCASVVTMMIRGDIPQSASGIFGFAMLAFRSAAFGAVCLWVAYLALEPTVRRLWPELIVSWTRLLAGDLGDRKLGSEVLVGAAIGLASNGIWCLSGWAKRWIDDPRPPTYTIDATVLAGLRPALATASDSVTGSIWAAFGILLLIALLRRPLRRDWAAAVVVWVFLSALGIAATGAVSPPAVTAWLLVPGLAVFAVARIGLVAGIAAWTFMGMTASMPLSTTFKEQYATASLVAVGVMAAIALYGYWAATRTPARRA